VGLLLPRTQRRRQDPVRRQDEQFAKP
jgi:hypothetical protein